WLVRSLDCPYILQFSTIGSSRTPKPGSRYIEKLETSVITQAAIGQVLWTRREFLAICGTAVLAGAADTSGQHSQSKARPHAERLVLIHLDGGPSQFETFDPKPCAPAHVRGEFGAIETSVPGMKLSALMPRMARIMDRAVLIRTVSHDEMSHDRARELHSRADS